jgi:glycyl-tRNA synthetase beta chain
MPDFLLELLTEEIPARMQPRAADDLARLFREALAKRGLAASPGLDPGAEVECHVTPRRLALFARRLPAGTQATREERRGPRADAPAGAVEGFLRSTGLSRDALEERETPKGRFLYATIETPGRATADVLPEAVSEAVGALPWPKSMRWGEASISMDSPRWVRPLTGVVALLDAEPVPLSVLGVAAGRETRGHRFMGPRGALAIETARLYEAQLRRAFVMPDAAERRRIIAEGAARVAAEAGLALIPDEGLVAENAGLTEWPVPLIGRFDPAFLDVPREVIQLTMRTNQKYFACADADGRLAPAFVCVANLEAPDGGATIVEGNRRVLAARLSDARFFWEQDLAQWRAAAANGPDGLWDHFAPKLERVTFHEKLGTMRDKAERVAALAEWLVTSGAVRPSSSAPTTVTPGLTRGGACSGPQGRAAAAPPQGSPGPDQVRADDIESLAQLARRAALLAKCDLVSSAVGEFPELQGVMGGHYALAVGEDPAVAAAVRDHYKPVGPSDAVPTEPVSLAVAQADKLDSLAGLFAVDEAPTGSRDPFALRRSALGLLRILTSNGIPCPMVETVQRSLNGLGLRFYNGDMSEEQFRRAQQGRERQIGPRRAAEVFEFLIDRLKVQQREAGVRHDLIDAVFALGNEDDLVRLLARVRALQAFVQTEDGANLLAAYKRAANILKQADFSPDHEPGTNRIPETGEEDPLVMVDDPEFAPVVAALAQSERAAEVAAGSDHPAQAELTRALEAALPAASAAIAEERFEDAMAALASLRAPIDRFFDEVMVNAPDAAVRRARLTLLARFTAVANSVADFSRIEG